MQSLKNMLWSSKRRRVSLAAVLCLVLAGTALAFALDTLTGSGTSQASTLPTQGSSVDASNNLRVGGAVPYNVAVTTSQLTNAATVNGAALSVTTSKPACDPGWFTFDNTVQYPFTVQPNSGNQVVASGQVHLTNVAADQSVCNGVSVALHIQLTS
jgi:hypothetical protein